MRPYMQLISRAERAEGIKLGMAVEASRQGIRPSKLESVFEKVAAGAWPDLPGALEHGTQGLIALSVLTGVPMGILAHLATRATHTDELAERERRSKIKYYRDVTKQLQQGLQPPAPSPV